MSLPDPDGPFKLRVSKGARKDLWLESLDVWHREAPVVRVTNWDWMFRNRSEYRFAPSFTDTEQFAYRYSSRRVIEIHQAILSELHIEAEVVARRALLSL